VRFSTGVTPTRHAADDATSFTPTLFIPKDGIQRIARWAIWQVSSCSVSADYVLRNTSTVTWLRTIPDRLHDQEIVLRPPRPLACDFPLRGRVSHSQEMFDPVDWLFVPIFDTATRVRSERVATSHTNTTGPLVRASQAGWGQPSGFVSLDASPSLNGPKTQTAGAVRCGLNARWSRWGARPATEPAGAACGRLRLR